MKTLSLNIEKLRKQYHKEWLLIAVKKMDKKTTTPLQGQLLAHSPHRYEIDKKSINYHKPALIVYSEDNFPKGYAAAF